LTRLNLTLLSLALLSLTLLSLTLLRLALLSPIGLGLRAGLLAGLSLASVARGLLSLPTLG